MTPLWVSGPPPPPRGDAEDHRSAPQPEAGVREAAEREDRDAAALCHGEPPPERPRGANPPPFPLFLLHDPSSTPSPPRDPALRAGSEVGVDALELCHEFLSYLCLFPFIRSLWGPPSRSLGGCWEPPGAVGLTDLLWAEEGEGWDGDGNIVPPHSAPL